MISERQFLRGYSHFWHQQFPGLDELYHSVRMQGIDHPGMERWAELYAGNVPARWNDIIAEISFNVFANAIQSPGQTPTVTEEEIKSAIVKMGLIRGVALQRSELGDPLLQDASEIARRLTTFFEEKSGLQVHHRLKGFGILNNLHPDVMAEKNIYEVKASRHPLKKEDLKQVLTYYLLALLNGLGIDKLCIVNPRRGTLYTMESDKLPALLGSAQLAILKQRFRDTLLD